VRSSCRVAADVCGRFVQTSSPELLAARFGALDTIATESPWSPRTNVTPSTPVPAVIDAGERRLGLLRWGFVPPWAPDPSSGVRPINARVEGAATSRLFAPALAKRRCVVPVDGWYEWIEEGGARQPWLMRPRGAAPVAVAALWSLWRPPDAPADTRPLGTVALMTTEAHGPAAEVHHRMPLLVPASLVDAWLDLTGPADAALLEELAAGPVDVDVVRVSRRVNDVRNEGPELLEEVSAPGPVAEDGGSGGVSGGAGR
jgi:putative SOS response-associated peptidase YedK